MSSLSIDRVIGENQCAVDGEDNYMRRLYGMTARTNIIRQIGPTCKNSINTQVLTNIEGSAHNASGEVVR